MRALRLPASLIVLVLLAGCSSFPVTPDERLGAVIVLNTSIAKRTATQLDNDEITVKQGSERIAMLETIEAGTQLGAAALKDERPTDAQGLLKAMEAALLELQKLVGAP